MAVESFGPGGAVGGGEVDVEGLETVFVVDAIREDLRARIRGANAGHIGQVVEVRWELMRKRRDAGGRPLEIGSLTITTFPQAPELPHALRDPPLPGPRLLILFELIVQVKQRSFLLARHMVLEEIRHMQQQRDIDAAPGRVEKHGESGRVAVDGLLRAREGEGGAIEVKFQGPVEEEELQGLQEWGGSGAFAVEAEDVFEEVSLLDIAAEDGEVI